MTETKYGKYILSKDMMPGQPEVDRLIAAQAAEGRTIDRTLLLGIQDAIVKGAFFVGCEIIWGLTGNGPVTIEEPHAHEFDEIVGFIGTNRATPRSLNGEIEFWLDDEPHIITETSLIYIPAGLKHCPVYFRKVNTPIAMFESAPNMGYVKKE